MIGCDRKGCPIPGVYEGHGGGQWCAQHLPPTPDPHPDREDFADEYAREVLREKDLEDANGCR